MIAKNEREVLVNANLKHLHGGAGVEVLGAVAMATDPCVSFVSTNFRLRSHLNTTTNFA